MSKVREFDFLIVGHGLAGATLSWHLGWLGQRVFVVDRPHAETASRVAAGLISPITGRRNTVSHRFDDFWSAAKPFYERVELETGSQFLLSDCEAFRVDDGVELSADAERYVGELVSLPEPFRASARQVRNAGRLNVGRYLDASQWSLENAGCFAVYDFALEDLEEFAGGFRIAKLGIQTQAIIFCQGIFARDNDRFGALPFEPTKGEVLEVDSHEKLSATVLGEAWVIPNAERSLVGTTYQRDYVDKLPTTQGRDEILARLSEVADWNPKVQFHRAAIRPTMRGRLPQIGVLRQPRLGFFNGLGSKGALRAPLVAEQFAMHLVNGEQLDGEFWFDVEANNPSGRPVRLTEVAQRHVASILRPGEIAIDATGGNGLDSVFLLEQVGRDGLVFVIDLQWEAIKRLRAKLSNLELTNYRLLHGSHADTARLVDAEYKGRVGAVMFNLGYLPRGDKQFVTKTSTTLAAIEQCLSYLRPGGVLSVVSYTGHDGGALEARSVEEFLGSEDIRRQFKVALPPTFLVPGPPRWCFATKRAEPLSTIASNSSKIV